MKPPVVLAGEPHATVDDLPLRAPTEVDHDFGADRASVALAPDQVEGDPMAVVLGAVFILGRGLYAHAYVNDPAKRGPGFALTLGANVTLVVGTIVGAIISLF